LPTSFSKLYGIPTTESENEKVELDKLYAAYDLWTKEAHYMAKNRGNFEEDLPLSGISVIDGKAIVRKKQIRRSGKDFFSSNQTPFKGNQ